MTSIFARRAQKARPEKIAAVDIDAPMDIATVGKATALEDAARAAKPKMNIMQRTRFNYATSECTRKHLGDAVEFMMEEAKERLKNRVMLAHDLQKKTDYGEYQIAAAQLDARITKHSNDIDRFFTRTLGDEIDALYEEREIWLARIQKRQLPAVLEEREFERLEVHIADALDHVQGKITLLTENHAKALESTLAMLGQRAEGPAGE
jgi:hypothetical protein